MLVFLLLVYQADAPPGRAAAGCAVLGAVLTLVMAFSQLARCLVLLMLPQFFSSMLTFNVVSLQVAIARFRILSVRTYKMIISSLIVVL